MNAADNVELKSPNVNIAYISDSAYNNNGIGISFGFVIKQGGVLMANLSSYEKIVREASSGEEVRDAFIQMLKLLYEMEGSIGSFR